MASFDSIVIGEDWISEHYFTTEIGELNRLGSGAGGA